MCTFSNFATVFLLDPYNMKLAKTYAALDVPQVFNLNFVYTASTRATTASPLRIA